MKNSCRISDPSKCGNVYYKGEWDYCPEYNIGDLVMCNSLLYLCLEHNAGKDPNGNKDYWHCISGGANPDPVPIGRIILDGGFSYLQYSTRFCKDFAFREGSTENIVLRGF